MKSLIAFWKKDIINKLIIVVLVGLSGMAFAFGWLVFHMPQGNSLSQAFTDFLPVQATPTFDINSYLTPGTAIPTTLAEVLPTSTFPPPTPLVELPTPVPQLLPTSTPELLSTPTLELPTQPVELPTQTVSSSGGVACIPNNLRQTGRVVEVVDGNTVRVLIEKLVYVVRYIGVAAPKDKVYSGISERKNTELVYGTDKAITLIKDVNDKDDRGRLLRYVLIGDKFVNLEMVQQGLGTALDISPDSACAQVFKQAEQSASTSKLGVWSLPVTPNSP